MSRKTKRLRQLKDLKDLETKVRVKDYKIANLEQQVAGYQNQANCLQEELTKLDDLVPWRIRAKSRFDPFHTIRFIGEFNLDLITRGAMNKGDRYSPYGRVDYKTLAPLLDSMARQMFREVVKELSGGLGSITTKMG